MSHGHDTHAAEPVNYNKMQPSEALTLLLKKAQDDHAACMRGALARHEDVVEKCSLTWGEVYQRYRQWGAYRAPFHTNEASDEYAAHWTKARQEKDDRAIKL